jgi:Leucine-rich repeat (LRR) protein
MAANNVTSGSHCPNTSHDDSSFEVIVSDSLHHNHNTNHEDWAMVDDQQQQQQQEQLQLHQDEEQYELQEFLDADTMRGLTLLNNHQTLTSEYALDVDRWQNDTMPCLAQFSHLSSLQVLDLYKNRYITHLHPSVCDLVHLQVLSLKRCEQLTTLPDAIGNLKQLHTLDLTDASNVSSLPDSLGDLSRYVQVCMCVLAYFS